MLVEDAACAVGSTYGGEPIGAAPALAVFSFHPRKLLTTGEGGMITTTDTELAERMVRLRQHGMSVNAYARHTTAGVVMESYSETGFNYRMTDIQAAIGLVQLAKIGTMVERRRLLADRYAEALCHVEGLILPDDPMNGTTNYQSYSVILTERFPLARDDADAAAAGRRDLHETWGHGGAPRAGLRRGPGRAAAQHRLPHRQLDHPAAVPPDDRGGHRAGCHGSRRRSVLRGPLMRSIVIIGAGGFGRETASLLEALRPDLEALGFLDDSPELVGGKVAGLPVLGTVDEAPTFDTSRFVVTAGSPRRFDVKRMIVERLGLDHERYATLVHPAATIGTEVEIGEGTVVFAGTVATHAVVIGRHVGIMPNVVLTHDDVVGDYAILGAGVLLAGGVVDRRRAPTSAPAPASAKGSPSARRHDGDGLGRARRRPCRRDLGRGAGAPPALSRRAGLTIRSPSVRRPRAWRPPRRHGLA